MNKKRLNNILPNLLMIVIIIVTFYIYRKYDYNYFSKGILEKGRTEFLGISRLLEILMLNIQKIEVIK